MKDKRLKNEGKKVEQKKRSSRKIWGNRVKKGKFAAKSWKAPTNGSI